MDEMMAQTVRERAYALWEKEGSPHGRDDEFWERARLMVEADGKAPAVTPLQQRTAGEHASDKALEETFPASDPPAFARPASGSKEKT